MLVQSGVGSIINAPTAADDVELDRASCEISNAPVSTPGPERKVHMNLGLRSILTTVAICGFFMTTTVIGRAQTVGQGSCIGACKGEVVGILVGIGAGGAALGIGVYYAVHHSHTLTGCAGTSGSGLQLQSQSDRKTYVLVGEIAGIKPGERVSVSGKKEKGSGIPQQFLVEKLTRDYGACPASS